MALPGIGYDETVDFPKTVKDSVTTLPFMKGGSVTLATTAVDENIVLVSDLRRFENTLVVATGVDDGAGNAAFLTDSVGDFINKGVQVGDTVNNTTDGSSATITAVTATVISGTLSGGTGDDWDVSDEYTIDKTLTHQSSRATEIRRVSFICDLACYIRFDGDASATNFHVELAAGESYYEDNLRIVSRVSFIQKTGVETPTVRFTVYGV